MMCIKAFTRRKANLGYRQVTFGYFNSNTTKKPKNKTILNFKQ